MNDSSRLRWSCPNPACNWSRVAIVALPGETVPRCVCGERLRKSEPLPAFTYLDFLRERRPAEQIAEPGKE